ncbi:unnamed protein product [Prunus armeniaca]|uniref:Uncharacterized protein n=1 Tax=Prunus armeniaca TaxID=36596 RepID=A0A6J5TI11_PRUAR|nr:unnamed protein product [Prunus armeniaca]
MSPLNELTTPTTAGPKMDAQVAGDGVEAFPGMHTERAEMEATVYGGVEGAEREAEVPADGVEAFLAMHIQGLKGKPKSLLILWKASQAWKSKPLKLTLQFVTNKCTNNLTRFLLRKM